MEQDETVDILLATYNGERYLRQQIDSILNQTNSNFRLIISDDKSSDGTADILKEYEKKDSRIKVFIQENNLGYIKNFEFLLKQVENDYYMLSDQDDVWLAQKVEHSLKKLKEDNADLVYTDLEVVDKDLNVMYQSFWKFLKIDYKIKKYKDYRVEYLYNVVTGCTLISKKRFIDLILPIPNNSKYVPHDYWIALAVAMNGKISYLDEKTIKYRQHGNNQIGTEKTSHKFKRFEQVRNLFITVKKEHFEIFVNNNRIFPDEIKQLNKEAYVYFKYIESKRYFNFKNLRVFHRLYRYDRLYYYLFNFLVFNLPIIAKFGFYIRYYILKLIGRRK